MGRVKVHWGEAGRFANPAKLEGACAWFAAGVRRFFIAVAIFSKMPGWAGGGCGGGASTGDSKGKLHVPSLKPNNFKGGISELTLRGRSLKVQEPRLVASAFNAGCEGEIKRHNFHFRLFTLCIRNPFMLIKVTEIVNKQVTYSVLSSPLFNAEKRKATFTVALPAFCNIFALANNMKSIRIYELKGDLRKRDEFETLRIAHAAGKPLSECAEKDKILNSMVTELKEWESKIEEVNDSEERKACRNEINLLKKNIKRYLYKKVCDICGALMDQRPATPEEQKDFAIKEPT